MKPFKTNHNIHTHNIHPTLQNEIMQTKHPKTGKVPPGYKGIRIPVHTVRIVDLPVRIAQIVLLPHNQQHHTIYHKTTTTNLKANKLRGTSPSKAKSTKHRTPKAVKQSKPVNSGVQLKPTRRIKAKPQRRSARDSGERTSNSTHGDPQHRKSTHHQTGKNHSTAPTSRAQRSPA